MDAKITWNPVKNGYPEKHRGFYLVTVEGIRMQDTFISISEWKKTDNKQGDFYLYGQTGKFNDLGCHVLAWAELPEPWKKEEDGR